MLFKVYNLQEKKKVSSYIAQYPVLRIAIPKHCANCC